jgi:hypothetical protein
MINVLINKVAILYIKTPNYTEFHKLLEISSRNLLYIFAKAVFCLYDMRLES